MQHSNLTPVTDVEGLPYEEQTTDDLIYIKAALEQEGIPVPTDLIAVLDWRGVIAE